MRQPKTAPRTLRQETRARKIVGANRIHLWHSSANENRNKFERPDSRNSNDKKCADYERSWPNYGGPRQEFSCKQTKPDSSPLFLESGRVCPGPGVFGWVSRCGQPA